MQRHGQRPDLARDLGVRDRVVGVALRRRPSRRAGRRRRRPGAETRAGSRASGSRGRTPARPRVSSQQQRLVAGAEPAHERERDRLRRRRHRLHLRQQRPGPVELAGGLRGPARRGPGPCRGSSAPGSGYAAGASAGRPLDRALGRLEHQLAEPGDGRRDPGVGVEQGRHRRIGLARSAPPPRSGSRGSRALRECRR